MLFVCLLEFALKRSYDITLTLTLTLKSFKEKMWYFLSLKTLSVIVVVVFGFMFLTVDTLNCNMGYGQRGLVNSNEIAWTKSCPKAQYCFEAVTFDYDTIKDLIDYPWVSASIPSIRDISLNIHSLNRMIIMNITLSEDVVVIMVQTSFIILGDHYRRVLDLRLEV